MVWPIPAGSHVERLGTMAPPRRRRFRARWRIGRGASAGALRTKVERQARRMRSSQAIGLALVQLSIEVNCLQQIVRLGAAGPAGGQLACTCLSCLLSRVRRSAESTIGPAGCRTGVTRSTGLRRSVCDGAGLTDVPSGGGCCGDTGRAAGACADAHSAGSRRADAGYTGCTSSCSST